MRRLVAGFGCAWILWSAPADRAATAPSADWTKVATVGGADECNAYAASLTRTAATPAQYVCLPDGQRPPRQ